MAYRGEFGGKKTMNKIILCGRITRDLEIRQSQSGKSVARFGFAVNRRYKLEGQPEADFFNCVAFGKVVETFEKCAVGKGTKLLLECEARNNNWTDNEGKKHYDIDFIVNTFEFCESKKTSNAEAATDDFEAAGFIPADDDDDTLPF